MDDEEWVIEDPSESQPEEPVAEAAAEEAKPDEAAAAEPEPEAEEPQAPTGPKKLIFQHWVRPKFLQYGYMYDYRRNYYDDVINYMDRRNQGLEIEKPRPQTWAERALRTYLARSASSSCLKSSNRDYMFLKQVSTGARFHRYHSKSLISRKYSRLGFNIVSI